jgi:hypothetical protein
MALRRARRLLVGIALVGAVPVALLQGTGSATTPERLQPATGIVEADGSATLGDGWRVDRPTPGYYVLSGPGAATDVDVESWDGDAELAINPQGDGTVVVTFTDGGRGVDTRFAWRALVTRR